MSWNLPKLPGYSFQDPTRTKFHVPRKLNYINGFPMVQNDTRGIGGDRMDIDNTAYLQAMDEFNYDPTLTYGNTCHPNIPKFIPRFVQYDKKLLIFKGYFKHNIYNQVLPRYVRIIYFLEDDTLTVTEPNVKNSGLWQGKVISRGKILKDDHINYWHWKDLNIGIEVSIQGLIFHIESCDDYTKHFLQSQGIEIPDGSRESSCEESSRTCEDFNKPLQNRKPLKSSNFLTRSDRILQFDAIWEDKNVKFDDVSHYRIFYYLNDKTMSVKEIYKKKSNHEVFPLLLRRTKVPKNWKKQPIDTQVIVADNSYDDDAYYSSEDLLVGRTINILGRLFLLIDCDSETRRFYKTVLNIEQEQALQEIYPEDSSHQIRNHDDTDLDDTLVSCSAFRSNLPFQDVIQYNTNTNKNLRYSCELISVHPEDYRREFILLYRLSDGTICIDELPKKNSGLMGGRFSGPSRINLPGTCIKYYTPDKFYIGAIIIVNCHKFRITGCDLFVYQYMKENPGKFPPEVIENVLEYHLKHANIQPPHIESFPCQDMQDPEIASVDENIQRPYIPLPTAIQGIECAQFLPSPKPEDEIEGSNPQSVVCLTGLSDKPQYYESQPTRDQRDCHCA